MCLCLAITLIEFSFFVSFYYDVFFLKENAD